MLNTISFDQYYESHSSPYLLKDVFEDQLHYVKGFPSDLTIEWSLSYCQGDGVAFYGQLSIDECAELLPKLYPNQKRIQRKLERLFVAIDDWECEENNTCTFPFKIERNSWGSRYSHWNTMTLDNEAGIACDLERDKLDHDFFRERNAYWYFASKKVDEYANLFMDFAKKLKEYIVETSCYLEKLGYKVLEEEEERIKAMFDAKKVEFVEALQSSLPILEANGNHSAYDTINGIIHQLQ